jgi:hypothetical protein
MPAWITILWLRTDRYQTKRRQLVWEVSLSQLSASSHNSSIRRGRSHAKLKIKQQTQSRADLWRWCGSLLNSLTKLAAYLLASWKCSHGPLLSGIDSVIACEGICSWTRYLALHLNYLHEHSISNSTHQLLSLHSHHHEAHFHQHPCHPLPWPWLAATLRSPRELQPVFDQARVDRAAQPHPSPTRRIQAGRARD